MTFTYKTNTKVAYLDGSDEYEEYSDEFEYEPDYEDLYDALADIIFCEYFANNRLADRIDYRSAVTKSILYFILSFEDDAFDQLLEQNYDELKDYFQDEAYDSIQ